MTVQKLKSCVTKIRKRWCFLVVKTFLRNKLAGGHFRHFKCTPQTVLCIKFSLFLSLSHAPLNACIPQAYTCLLLFFLCRMRTIYQRRKMRTRIETEDEQGDRDIGDPMDTVFYQSLHFYFCFRSLILNLLAALNLVMNIHIVY